MAKMSEENRRRASERMKAMHAAKKAQTQSEAPVVEDRPEVQVAEEESVTDLQKQIKELQNNIALMQQMMVSQASGSTSGGTGVQMDTRSGELIGEWEKYLVDPAAYPDPTPRLASEQRLRPLGFEYNYELEYDQSVSSYQTKTGKNVREPKFHIKLNRVVMDEQGNPTNKRYIARQIIFHEDPQAALAIAREQGLPVDKSDEKLFLNEMRYYRVRDWLFDIFWPKPVQESQKVHDEVIGGMVVQTFTKNSVEPSEIAFDKV